MTCGEIIGRCGNQRRRAAITGKRRHLHGLVENRIGYTHEHRHASGDKRTSLFHKLAAQSVVKIGRLPSGSQQEQAVNTTAEYVGDKPLKSGHIKLAVLRQRSDHGRHNPTQGIQSFFIEIHGGHYATFARQNRTAYNFIIKYCIICAGKTTDTPISAIRQAPKK